MEDEWNLKEHMMMKYHHMLEEGTYPEDAIEILRKKLLEAQTNGTLDINKIYRLFGDIDTDYMKEFWQKRAKEHELNESLTNLEDDSELLAIKIRGEEKKIIPCMDWKGKTIVDLGSGYGNWAFKFIDEGAKHVICVDYIKEMCKKGTEIAKREGIKNIEFLNVPIQEFRSDDKYDIVFISGVSVHLNDTDYNKVIQNIKSFTKPGSYLILRDGTGVPKRHSFNKEHSERLGTLYSGIYRSREDYINLFYNANFILVKDQNIFPEGHPLNQFPHTRLRIYKFRRIK